MSWLKQLFIAGRSGSVKIHVLTQEAHVSAFARPSDSTQMWWSKLVELGSSLVSRLVGQICSAELAHKPKP